MKMLIIEIFNVNRGNKDFLRIVSQPFRGFELYNNTSRFEGTNGFTIRSNSSPEIKTNCLMLRGTRLSDDDIILVVPNAAWLERLASTVREYNNYLEDSGGGIKTPQPPISNLKINDALLETMFDIEERIL